MNLNGFENLATFGKSLCSNTSAESHLMMMEAAAYLINLHNIKTVAPFALSVAFAYSGSALYFDTLYSELIKRVDYMDIQLIWATDNQKTLYNEGQRLYNMYFIDSLEALISVSPPPVYWNLDYNEYHYIVLYEISGHNIHTVRLILRYCHRSKFINCSVQAETDDGRILVYSYFPFSSHDCGDVIPVVVDEFANGTFVNGSIFPPKIKNMHGCPLRITSWNVPPFMQLESQGNHSFILKGLEGNLLNEISRQLNFTINLLNIEKGMLNTFHEEPILRDFIKVALSRLRKGATDIGIGFIKDKIRQSNYFSPLIPHLQVRMVISVLRYARKYSSMEILGFPFTTTVWLYILSVLLLQTFLIPIFNKHFEKLSHYTFNQVVPSALGNPMLKIPKESSKRIIYMAWIIFHFIWRNIYCAVLFELFCRNLYRVPPLSIQELIDYNYSIVCNYDILSDVENFLNEYPLRLIIMNSYNESTILEYLKDHPEEKLAALTSSVAVSVEAEPNHFFILPQDVVSSQIIMYLEKHSIFINELNEKISWILSAGLVKKWIDNAFSVRDQNQMIFYEQQNYINQNDLLSLFYLWGILLLIAFVVFLLEKAWKRFKIIII